MCNHQCAAQLRDAEGCCSSSPPSPRPPPPPSPPVHPVGAQCPAGQAITEDTQGKCCWQGQAWNGQACVGTPTQCPAGQTPTWEGCKLPLCLAGTVHADGLHCCWPGQPYSKIQSKCLGPPTCPPGLAPLGDGCGIVDAVQEAHRTSCAAGNAAACTDLGWDGFEHGKGLPVSAERAAEAFERGCDAGNAPGCLDLGIYYRDGRGVPVDVPHAARLFERACALGNGAGCTSLGILADNGTGIARDVRRSTTFYRRACDLGDMVGCSALGSALVSGKGVPVDRATGLVLLRGACAAQHQWSCGRLAELGEPPQAPAPSPSHPEATAVDSRPR